MEINCWQNKERDDNKEFASMVKDDMKEFATKSCKYKETEVLERNHKYWFDYIKGKTG